MPNRENKKSCFQFFRFLDVQISNDHYINYLLSLPGCCWINSRRYFLAKSMNPFIGLLGLSAESFSFFLAGEDGGDILDETETSLGMGLASGERGSSVENSNRRNRSQRSGVLTASGWFGGRQMSPTESSWHGIPYLSIDILGCAELHPEKKEKIFITGLFYGFSSRCLQGCTYDRTSPCHIWASLIPLKLARPQDCQDRPTAGPLWAASYGLPPMDYLLNQIKKVRNIAKQC